MSKPAVAADFFKNADDFFNTFKIIKVVVFYDSLDFFYYNDK